MAQKTFRYKNDDITVVWQPEMCIHSRICWKGLQAVFDPNRRPWIVMEAATTQQIIKQVKQCPSGALSIEMNNTENNQEQEKKEQPAFTRVDVTASGPFIIHTNCIVKHPDGREEEKIGRVSLCRCGKSKKYPYCDGSHKVTEG